MATATLAVVACSSDSRDDGALEAPPLDAGSDAGPAPRDAEVDPALAAVSTVPDFEAYLTGKTLVMAGADIPPDPLGTDANVYYGFSSQCWNSIGIQFTSPGMWTVTWVVGTYTGPMTTGGRGTCNTAKASAQPVSASGPYTIADVQPAGACFDIDAPASQYGQRNAGRGSLSPDGETLSLEVFIDGQATGATCADGPVGSPTVTLNGAPFTGNAVQVYRVP